MAAESSSCQKSYDVFLNFRGKDTRNGFTAFLHEALWDNGIETFMDSKDVAEGTNISPSLFTAIENSMISVVVFSENYASSTWCLEELAKILECKNTREQTVLPIFYKVRPSNVRRQKGSFADDLANHENKPKAMEKMQTWKKALTEVGNIRGWVSGDRSEPNLIKEIVEAIAYRVICRPLKGTEQAINGEHALTVGIWGMEGTGKTTLARAVYDHFSSQFEGCCFLENVGKESKKYSLAYLARKLFSQLLGATSSRTGLSSMKARLRCKRVLIVLDDVDDLKQLEFLGGRHHQFGSGSRIIITATEQHLLNTYGVNEMHKAENLNLNNAMRPFRQYAIEQGHHTQDFMKLFSLVQDYSKGFQHICQDIVGSFTFRKSKLECGSELDNKPQSDEDEQLYPLGNGSIHQSIHYPVSTDFKICAGCSSDIIPKQYYLKCMGKVWHPACFRCHACEQPISDYEFSLHRESPYHKSCYMEKRRQKCDVCGYFAGPTEYKAHPVFFQKYCPSHEHDGTPSCFTCERKEPWGTRYLTLKDGRKLCPECLGHAIMYTHECQLLYLDVKNFCESLNVQMEQQVPLLLVERQSPSEATRGEKSSVIDIIREPYKLVPGGKLTTFHILHGLPRLLTGQILAHLMMRLWLQQRVHRPLSQRVDGGICQVLAYMWLDNELRSGHGSSGIASTSSMAVTSTSSRKGERSKVESRFGEFLKYQIESDTSENGKGFKAGYEAVLRHGLQTTVEHISRTGEFPNSPPSHPRAKDNKPPRRPASFHNSQPDIPHLLEGLPPMNTEKLHKYLGTSASLVERQARAVETQVQGQSSFSKSSFFDDFKKLCPPYFSGTLDPMEAEAWILKIEKIFDVIDCSEEQKTSYAARMLDKEADHWWRKTERLLVDQRPIVWRQFKEAFYKKYFPNSVRQQKVREFVCLEQGDMTVAQYEAKFMELSRFAPQLITTEKEKTLKFQDGLRPYLKNKISILKLSVYSEVVDRALNIEKDNEKSCQYKKQQRKRSRSDDAHDNQTQKRFASTKNLNKGKVMQNAYVICPTCGKKHESRPCYRETKACFGCQKKGHMIQDCPENKKFSTGKSKKKNKENK